jgi:hypothetical protein
VLVSSAILLGLLVLLLGACEGGARFWNNAERRRAPLSEAGAALRLIAHDLRSAVVTADPQSLMIRREKNGDSLFFLVSHASDHRPETVIGDLCATGYFLAPSLNGLGQDLYRFHASGDKVLEAFEEGKLPELYATASTASANTELLARHVASLEVRPIDHGSASDHPAALILNITTVDGISGSRLAEGGMDPNSREKLLSRHGVRLGSVISLPPPRISPCPR